MMDYFYIFVKRIVSAEKYSFIMAHMSFSFVRSFLPVQLGEKHFN